MPTPEYRALQVVADLRELMRADVEVDAEVVSELLDRHSIGRADRHEVSMLVLKELELHSIVQDVVYRSSFWRLVFNVVAVGAVSWLILYGLYLVVLNVV